MNHSKKENVSAMMDDALSSLEVQETIADLKNNAELRATWKNYHFISSMLQNSLESEWLAAEIKVPARNAQTEVVIEKHRDNQISNQSLEQSSEKKA